MIANNWQYDDPISIEELNVNGTSAVAQPLPEDAEGASPHVSEDEISKNARAEGIIPQQTVEIT